MDDEVKEHKCHRDQGKEQVGNDIFEENIQTEQNACKAYLGSEISISRKCFFYDLLNFTSILLAIFILFRFLVRFIHKPNFVYLKWCTQGKNGSHIRNRHILQGYISIKQLLHITFDIGDSPCSSENAIDFFLTHIFDFFSYVHFGEDVQRALICKLTTSRIIIRNCEAVCAIFRMRPDLVFKFFDIEKQILLD